MAETELAPCALCLQVFESASLLPVQLPPIKGVPGISRHLCSGCVSAIEAVLPEGKRFKSTKPLSKGRGRARLDAAVSEPAEPEAASGSSAASTNENSEGSEEVAKAD